MLFLFYGLVDLLAVCSTCRQETLYLSRIDILLTAYIWLCGEPQTLKILLSDKHSLALQQIQL